VQDSSGHIPVLLEPVLRLLDPKPGQTVLDCTLGRGGHAEAILPRIAPGGRYIGLDLDESNVESAKRKFAEAPVACDFVHANFAGAGAVMARLGVTGVDVLLADLGVSSTQLDDPARGLSFARCGPLDMRLDPSQTTTAADLVNQMSEQELAEVIWRFGQERLSRRIARKIVEERRREPIRDTRRIAEICSWAYGPAAARSRIDPATRTFQALRMAVNDESGNLSALLERLPGLMKPGGRAAVISFHSLEDRPVKQAFAALAASGAAERLTRKPVTADQAELALNRRSRSAKLRAILFTGNSNRR
jgi:16S rRNA (cytosine1402-N4)-methyltransferase